MKRDIFQALADPTRRAILMLVAAHTMTPNALAEHFDSSRQAVSKHIKILTESRLLFQEKVGREIYYHLDPARMKEINGWLEEFSKIWQKRFKQLDDVLNTLKKERE